MNCWQVDENGNMVNHSKYEDVSTASTKNAPILPIWN